MSKRYTSNLQVAHAYAHNLTEAGHYDNTSFANEVFYSYSTAIAAKVNNIVLLTTQSYSNTTSRHKSNLRSALANVCEVVSARYIPIDLRNEKAISDIHKLNVEYFFDELNRTVNDFVNAKKSRTVKARAVLSAFDCLDDYAQMFNLDWDNQPIIQQAVNTARTEIGTHTVRSLSGDKELHENYQMMLKESWRKWRSCETDTLPMNKLSSPIALRVTSKRIETSRGASMPRRDVARIWPDLKSMWQSCAKNPTCNERLRSTTSNPTMQFGQFTGVVVSEVFIRIGCHDIPWGEIVDVAKQLGLDVTGVDNANTTN